MSQEQQAARVAQPAWYREYHNLFLAGAGHGFLLYGDVHGVTPLGVSQLRFMQSILHAGDRSIVVYYHRAVGITFALPSMRTEALDLLGPEWSPPTSESDRFAAALSATGMARSTNADIFRSMKKPETALAMLEQLLRTPQARGKVAVIIDGIDTICPPTPKANMSEERLATLSQLCYWGTDSSLGQQDNPIFLLSGRLADVHPDLRQADSGYKTIEVGLPDEASRYDYIQWYLQEHRREHPIPLLDLTQEDLARNTAGLNLRQIEDILLLGAFSNEQQQNHETEQQEGVSRLLVKSRKDAIIRQEFSELITMLDPLPGGFNALGGMEQLIAWTRAEVITPLREGRRRDVPKGILLVGPPGNGKTLFVEAAAFELGYNAISLRMSSILGGVVGTSERNLQVIFDLARSLSPTFIFIDEIDQSHLSERGNHSGSPVAANLFGSLLQFLGDETLRGHVLLVAATNAPERLDAALMRPGRFDVVFPVLCPDERARRSILAVQARIQEVELAPNALNLLTRQTDKFSAADLFAVIKEARLLARQTGHQQILHDHAQQALENLRPTTLASVDGFTRKALDVCNNLRFLPDTIAQRERERRAAIGQQAEVSEHFLSQPDMRSSRWR